MTLTSGSPPDGGASIVGQTVADMAILRKLGQGGMGEVYLARVVRTGELRAIKVIRDEWQDDGGASVKRFDREATVLARLQHPAIVRVFQSGTLPSGWPFLAMEYVEGTDLQDRVTRAGALTLSDGLQVIGRIASALEHAHGLGIVHRDLKPGNVVLRGEAPAEATLIDFGLVKVLSDGFMTKLTNDREVLGSPHYMAPEQARGERNLGGAVDIYALAGVAYFALTGEPPFAGRSLLALITAHMNETPARLSSRLAGVPPLLDQLLVACLAKRPEERPHADELAAHLGNLARTVPATPSTPPRPPVAAALGSTVISGDHDSAAALAARLWSPPDAAVPTGSMHAALFNQTCAVLVELGAAMASVRPRLGELAALVARIRARQDELTAAELELALVDSVGGGRGELAGRVVALGEAQTVDYRALFTHVVVVRDEVQAPELSGLYRELDTLVERLRLDG